MAINNWRYVVTWGYRNPDGTIVEEVQYAPNQVTTNDDLPHFHAQSTEFSPADIFALQAQWYADQGDNAMANAYWGVANNLWRYSTFANNTLNTADALLDYVRQNEAWLQAAARWAYNTILGDLENQRDYVNEMFGPNGQLTKEVNSYYDDLWNYLATDAWRQAATIAAQWLHSWASLWAIRAQQNEAYNESFWRYVQAKEQQINAKMNIASNLINFMSTLRKEYWDTTNQYVIDLYKRANDLYNTIAQSAAADIDNYNKALATPASSGGSSNDTTTTLLNRYNQLKSAWLTDDQIAAQLAAEGYISATTNNQDSNWNNVVVNDTKKTQNNKTSKKSNVSLSDVFHVMQTIANPVAGAVWILGEKAGWLFN